MWEGGYILREERWVEIEAAELGGIDDALRDEKAERDGDDEVDVRRLVAN